MMSSNFILVRRVTVCLVALFASFLGSFEAAFAEETLGNENIETVDTVLDTPDSGEAIADDAGDAGQDTSSVTNDASELPLAQATDAENIAVTDAGETGTDPVITTDASILNSEDWSVVPEDRVGARVGTEIAVGIGFSALVFTGFAFLAADGACVPSEEDCSNTNHGSMAGAFILGAIGVYAPTFAVHISHLVFGGEGSIGWTYLGGLIGAAAGVGLGAITLPFGYGLFVMPALGFAGCMVGAILGYELTNSKNREQKYGTISRVYPVLELGPERNVFGVGIEF